jgi:hypothetical protein
MGFRVSRIQYVHTFLGGPNMACGLHGLETPLTGAGPVCCCFSDAAVRAPLGVQKLNGYLLRTRVVPNTNASPRWNGKVKSNARQLPRPGYLFRRRNMTSGRDLRTNGKLLVVVARQTGFSPDVKLLSSIRM